jgi:hypothetical protein
VAALVEDQPDQIWLDRARRQLRLTRLRLNFRQFSYAQEKGQLPLPPEDQWQIQLDPSGPQRQTIQGHELVTIDFTFAATLLTDQASPEVAEPALAEIGGVWQEPFIFPADPDFSVQRTGNACINEGGFPPNSFDSENAWHFYDFDCAADSGGAQGCHRTLLPDLSCREALLARTGMVETTLRFERLLWDEELASAVRSGVVTHLEAPDLMVVADDLANNRIAYRYVTADDCALEEGAVGGSGWRRLLQFDATVHNVGGRPLHIGPVVAEDLENHVFDYNLCHDHFHYTNYGDFFLENLEQISGSKQAFCVQSTNRLSNNESSPLVHDYSCRFQGIQAGWVDEYIAGLDAQWIDITDLELPASGRTVELGFASNGDRFLCEGQPQLDENGELLWEPSGFTTAAGESINRPQCEFTPDWESNNVATLELFVPAAGGMVTSPCRQDEIGPLRNCGFTVVELPEADALCRPGQLVELPVRVAASADPQVVRVCEWSDSLDVGLACPFEDSIANRIVSVEETTVAFTCPAVRDAAEETPAGRYSLYTAPLWPEDDSADISLSSDTE